MLDKTARATLAAEILKRLRVSRRSIEEAEAGVRDALSTSFTVCTVVSFEAVVEAPHEIMELVLDRMQHTLSQAIEAERDWLRETIKGLMN